MILQTLPVHTLEAAVFDRPCHLLLQCLVISCGHESKLHPCVDAEIVITASTTTALV